MNLEKLCKSIDKNYNAYCEGLYELNKIINMYFQMKLRSTPKAQEYLLKERDINARIREKYELGYGGKLYSDELLKFLMKNGYSLKELLEVGIFKLSDKTGKYFCTMQERITFPIKDYYGNIVGFNGRYIGEKAGIPKYINSNSTILFNKKRNLYGEEFVVIGDPVIIVEGCMDVIAMKESGFVNTVATLGTALTSEHVYEIQTLSDDVIIFYDNDKAGKMACERAVNLFKNSEINVFIAKSNYYKDPDEIRKHEGNEGLEAAIDSAVGEFYYYIERELSKNTPIKKIAEKLYKRYNECSPKKREALSKQLKEYYERSVDE